MSIGFKFDCVDSLNVSLGMRKDKIVKLFKQMIWEIFITKDYWILKITKFERNGLQKRNCADITIEITADIIKNKVDLILGVEICKVSSTGVMSTMGVNVCHHGEGGDVVQAPSQHLLGVQVFHQRAWHHKFGKVQKILVAIFFPVIFLVL